MRVAARTLVTVLCIALAAVLSGCRDANIGEATSFCEKSVSDFQVKLPNQSQDHLTISCADCCAKSFSPNKPLTGSMKDGKCECRAK